MRMTGTEARHLLAPFVHDHRHVWCTFTSPGLYDARSGVLWSLDGNALTIRQTDGQRFVDLHVPFTDVTIEYFAPEEAPSGTRPAEPLTWFDGALYLQDPELSEAGVAIELKWVLWIANANWGQRAFAASAARS